MTPALAAARLWRSRGADALVVAGLLAVLVAAECAGRSGRVLARSPIEERRDSPEAVVDVLRASEVRGRVLAHFARDIAVQPDPDGGPAMPLSGSNYVRRAVEAGYVRRVVHVLSEKDWPSAEGSLRRLPAASAAGPGFQVPWEGTPVDVVQLRDLPSLGEPYVANVDVNHWSAEELAQIAARLAQPPRADVVLWWGDEARPPEVPGAAER